jgi:hypothetical protein
VDRGKLNWSSISGNESSESSTIGVEPSVLGGDPHVNQLSGTESTSISSGANAELGSGLPRNVIVNVESDSVEMISPSGCEIGNSIVPET